MPTLLIVAASPNDQDRIRLSAEVRDIREALRRSKNREDWRIESNEAATIDDLRRALLDNKPAIVHFAGHGAGAGGLCFEDRDGKTHFVHAEPLARLFHNFKENLKCVVLNACYSSVQAESISGEIDYLIGMKDGVEDGSALKFSVAFYDAIFAGTDFRTAFDLGCTNIDLHSMNDADVPIFMTGARLKKTELPYSAVIPEIERVLYAYFNTPFAERGEFTTSGSELQPLLLRHYGERMHHRVQKIQVSATRPIDDSHWLVQISGASNKFMYVKVLDRNVLVDWEASVGYWSVPYKTYMALGSREPVVARVSVELGDYYNYEMKDQRKFYQSVEMRTLDGDSKYGYVRKHTEEYRKLIDIINDGNSHRVTLLLVKIRGEGNLSVIEKFLSKSWIYHPTPEESSELS